MKTKYEFTLSIGFPGANRSEIIDVPEHLGLSKGAWKSLPKELKEDRLVDVWNTWSKKHITGGWKKVKEE